MRNLQPIRHYCGRFSQYTSARGSPRFGQTGASAVMTGRFADYLCNSISCDKHFGKKRSVGNVSKPLHPHDILNAPAEGMAVSTMPAHDSNALETPARLAIAAVQ
jgi:hypothetical protein